MSALLDALDYADGPEPELASLHGVALHTDRDRHWRTCPDCGGAGEVWINTSSNRDPQCDEPVSCPNPNCYQGEIDEWVDPLLRLRIARRTLLRWRTSPRENLRYGEARQRAVSPLDRPLPGSSSGEWRIAA